MKNYMIPVSTGIFSHSVTMASAVWLFLWYIDKTTREEQEAPGVKVGCVLGGAPVRDERAAHDLGRSERTIREWRGQLFEAGYITQKRTPVGYVVMVKKSKKWLREVIKHPRNTSVLTGKSGQSERRNQSVQYRQYKDSTKTVQQNSGLQPVTRAQQEAVAESVWEQIKATPEGKKLAEVFRI